MAIEDAIGRSSGRSSSSSSSTPEHVETIAELKARLEREEQNARHEKETENIRKQIELKHQLNLADIKGYSEAYKKALIKVNKEINNTKLLEEQNQINILHQQQLDLVQQRMNIVKEGYALVLKDSSKDFKEKLGALKDLAKLSLPGVVSKLANDLPNKLEGIIDKYIDFQKGVNARLQGSGRTFSSAEKLLSTAVGVQPFVRTDSMIGKLSDLVDTGIAYNVELRAFLGTVSENIASTFEVTNASLLRIVRLQQEDSTAARLGLEASLTRYFNGMYQNTEYLNSAFDAVSENLLEASSTMNKDQAIQFEYQVQKWLGSLYSVGMSDSTVQGIAQALGYLGSGNIEALGGSQYQNLLVMAASRAGMNYSDLLINGLNSGSTNVLLASMTEYLKEIAEGTNQVVKSELAQTFGVTMSDLTAAVNLGASEIKNISSKSMNFASSIAELSLQMTLLPTRLNTSLMIDNMWNNLMWGLGSNVAANPLLSAMWKVTNLIQDNTGGINIPMVLGMGTGFDLNTTVENLVKLGIIGVGSLGMIGELASGLSSTLIPASMLYKLDAASALQNLTALGGRGLATATSGLSTSSTVYAGNANGSDIASSATQGASDQTQAEVDNSKSDKDMTEMTDYIQQDVSRIVDMLDYIMTNGVKTVSVY